MPICSQCGLTIWGVLPGVPAGADVLALCPHHHHHTVYGKDWAQSNRIWCDFFHRGVVPKGEPTSDEWFLNPYPAMVADAAAEVSYEILTGDRSPSETWHQAQTEI